MREILFRGKTAGEEWIEGFPMVFTENYVQICRPMEHSRTVYPETIGQYTGLTDKNGKKIFEGDIVECNGGFYQIVFEDGCFGAYQDEHYFFTLFSLCVAVEVIGNIHDNPELLKGSGE